MLLTWGYSPTNYIRICQSLEETTIRYRCSTMGDYKTSQAQYLYGLYAIKPERVLKTNSKSR